MRERERERDENSFISKIFYKEERKEFGLLFILI
jgi:hypothetical protein